MRFDFETEEKYLLKKQKKAQKRRDERNDAPFTANAKRRQAKMLKEAAYHEAALEAIANRKGGKR